MANLKLILLILAFVLFLVAAGVPFPDASPNRVRIIAAGLAMWVASFIF